jgi:hypothetical protein
MKLSRVFLASAFFGLLLASGCSETAVQAGSLADEATAPAPAEEESDDFVPVAGCGGNGQLCCLGERCKTGLVCMGEICRPCGGNGQPCCATVPPCKGRLSCRSDRCREYSPDARLSTP